VHQHLRQLLDDPGHADANAEYRGRVDAAVAKDRVQPGQDLRDDHVDLVPVGVQRVLGLGPLGHGQVEQLDPGPRLAYVDPDDVPVLGVHPEHRPRPPAVGVGQPGLDHDALIEQLADHVRHRRGAQPGRCTQVLTTARLVEVQRPQDCSPVVAPQIPDRAALAVPH